MNKHLPPVSAIIVDDIADMRQYLRTQIQALFPQIEILGEAADVPQAVALVRNTRPQIIFLDVEMPQYSGFELLPLIDLQGLGCHIIFTTAHSHFAAEAFALAAVDFLLKPIKPQELARAIHRTIERINEREQIAAYQILQQNATTADPAERTILLKQSEGARLLRLREIIYLQADGPYTQFFLADGSKEIIAKPLVEYERLEHTGIFFRSNRSYILNVLHIKKISKLDGGTILLHNGTEIPISQHRRQALFDLLEKHSL